MRTLHRQVSIEAVEFEISSERVLDEDERQQLKIASECFVRFLHFLLPKTNRAMCAATIAKKVIAAAHVLNPELLGDRTLRKIERETNGEVRNYDVCALAKEFEAEFGVRSARRSGATTHTPRSKESFS